MRKYIQFSGLTTTPSDYISQDGDMAVCHNAVVKDGEISPVFLPKFDSQCPNGTKLVHIHNVVGKKNYLFLTTSGKIVYYIDEAQKEMCTIDGTYVGMSSTGNVLTITTTTGLYYARWTDGKYRYLGPLKSIYAHPYIKTNVYTDSFFSGNLSAEVDTAFPVNADGNGKGVNVDLMKKLAKGKINEIPLSGTVREDVYDKVFAVINTYRRRLQKLGVFQSPFFVRTALRMYDGRFVCHSAPHLCCPNSDGKPLFGLDIIESTGSANIRPVFTGAELKLELDIPNETWDEVITSICVFVSLPVDSYSDSSESIMSIIPSTDSAIAYGELSTQYSQSLIKDLYESFKQDDEHAYTYEYRHWTGNHRLTFNWSFYEKQGYGVTGVYLAINTLGGDAKITNMSGIVIGGIYTGEETFGLDDRDNYKIYEMHTVCESGIVMFSRDVSCIIIYKKKKEERAYPVFSLKTERADGKSMFELLEKETSFYLLKEFDFKELREKNGTGRIVIEDLDIEEYAIQNLATHTTLPDTGQNSKINYARFVSSLNNRLVFSLEAQRYNLESIDAYSFVPEWLIGNDKLYTEFDFPRFVIHKAYLEINNNGSTEYQEIPVNREPEDEKGILLNYISFFFTPCVYAVGLVCKGTSYGGDAPEYNVCMRIPLKRHKTLQGCYAFHYLNSIFNLAKRDDDVCERIGKNPHQKIVQKNKVIFSDADNPFYFDERNTISVGKGEVFATASASRSMNEGQFGQYPLYAFATDGVWAIDINEEGAPIRTQNISRDVCTNPSAICSTDNTVVYPTKRGLMNISGSVTECISKSLEDKAKLSIDNSHYTSIQDILETALVAGAIGDTPVEFDFRTFVQNPATRIGYNPHMNRIVVAQNGHPAFVKDIESGIWCTIDCPDFYSFVNNYPSTLMQKSTGEVYDISENDYEAGPLPMILMTRPIKFGNSDELKTVRMLAVRGDFDKDDVKVALWGSYDLRTWTLVNSSNNRYLTGRSGSGYKYFALLMLPDDRLSRGETIDGIEAEVVTKFNNKIR